MSINKDYNSDKHYSPLPNVDSLELGKIKSIQRAIEEVKINTPDSVTLAVSTLTLKSIKMPKSLQLLDKAHEQFASKRTKEIAEKLLKLKNESLKDLTKLLSQFHSKS